MWRVGANPQTRTTAPAIDRARVRTWPPSLPERTSHWPLGACPTISPTWCDQTTTAPTWGLPGLPYLVQFQARLNSGPPPRCVRIHQPHHCEGRGPTPPELRSALRSERLSERLSGRSSLRLLRLLLRGEGCSRAAGVLMAEAHQELCTSLPDFVRLAAASPALMATAAHAASAANIIFIAKPSNRLRAVNRTPRGKSKAG
jgi:hypothetical protein